MANYSESDFRDMEAKLRQSEKENRELSDFLDKIRHSRKFKPGEYDLESSFKILTEEEKNEAGVGISDSLFGVGLGASLATARFAWPRRR